VRLRVFVLAFVAFAALGGTWALASPVLSNPDEPAHSVKAAGVVRGELVPPKEPLPDEGPGGLLRGGFTTLVEVPYSYTWQSSNLPLCYIYDASAAAGCAHGFGADPEVLCTRYDRGAPESCPPPVDEGSDLARWTTLIGRYPPPYYAAVGWPTLLDPGRVGFYAMRFLSVGVNAALLAAALACAAAVRRLRFLAIGVIVAATPMTLILTGAINPNGIEISAAICTWVALTVALLSDDERLPRGVLVALAAGAVALAWARPLATLWLAVIALTTLVAFGDRVRLATRLRGRPERITIAVIGVASLGAAAWTLFSDNLDNNAGYEPRGLGLWSATRHSLGLTPSYLRQMVAVFGWQREPAPLLLSLAWGAAALALVAVAVWPRRGSERGSDVGSDVGSDRASPPAGVGWRPRATILALVALAVLLPTIMQAPTAERFGFVWSGRYALAVAAGVPIMSAAMIGMRRLSPTVTRALAGALVVVVAVGQVVAHWANMRRYVVGLDGPVVYLGQDGWLPPLGAPVLLAVVVASAGALAWLCFRIVVSPAVR
jgi:hypothetical protein